jgi:hypothetical protein
LTESLGSTSNAFSRSISSSRNTNRDHWLQSCFPYLRLAQSPLYVAMFTPLSSGQLLGVLISASGLAPRIHKRTS